MMYYLFECTNDLLPLEAVDYASTPVGFMSVSYLVTAIANVHNHTLLEVAVDNGWSLLLLVDEAGPKCLSLVGHVCM